MSNWLIPSRIDVPELLDLGHGTPEEVRGNLQDMWRFHRMLGGLPTLTRHLYPRLKPNQTLVDIGTGAGNILRLLATRDPSLTIIGIDITARNLDVARSGQPKNVSLIQADALSLPFKPGQVDYFLSNFFIHHLAPDQLIKLLATTYKIARCGIIMCDQQRHRLPLWGFRLIAPFLTRNRLTKYDGLTSIRRAYTPEELLGFARSAGIPNPIVHRHLPWRMTLVADK